MDCQACQPTYCTTIWGFRFRIVLTPSHRCVLIRSDVASGDLPLPQNAVMDLPLLSSWQSASLFHAKTACQLEEMVGLMPEQSWVIDYIICIC